MAHLAAFMQRDEGFGHVVGIHQRIRPVDQQQIEVVGMQMAQRLFRALYDMVAVGDVMADRIAGLGGGGDAALGHQLQRLAQRRLQAQRVAERLFAGVTP